MAWEVINHESAKDIALKCSKTYNHGTGESTKIVTSVKECYDAALLALEQKDKLIDLLLSAIEHSYYTTNNDYGDLSREVSDKVEYIKKLKYKVNSQASPAE